MQDGETASAWGAVRAESSRPDPLSVFAVVAGQGKRNARHVV